MKTVWLLIVLNVNGNTMVIDNIATEAECKRVAQVLRKERVASHAAIALTCVSVAKGVGL